MLGEALRLIRVFHDMKQYEAADRLGISKSYLSEVEKGRKEPTLDLLKRYEPVFGIPVSSILFFSENIGKPSAKEKARTFVADKVLKILKFVEDRDGVTAAD